MGLQVVTCGELVAANARVVTGFALIEAGRQTNRSRFVRVMHKGAWMCELANGTRFLKRVKHARPPAPGATPPSPHLRLPSSAPQNRSPSLASARVSCIGCVLSYIEVAGGLSGRTSNSSEGSAQGCPGCFCRKKERLTFCSPNRQGLASRHMSLSPRAWNPL